MTQTDWIVMSVILNLGQAYIIYKLFTRNSYLTDTLKKIKDEAQNAIGPDKKKKPPETKKSKSFWKIYD